MDWAYGTRTRHVDWVDIYSYIFGIISMGRWNILSRHARVNERLSKTISFAQSGRKNNQKLMGKIILSVPYKLTCISVAFLDLEYKQFNTNCKKRVLWLLAWYMYRQVTTILQMLAIILNL